MASHTLLLASLVLGYDQSDCDAYKSENEMKNAGSVVVGAIWVIAAVSLAIASCFCCGAKFKANREWAKQGATLSYLK